MSMSWAGIIGSAVAGGAAGAMGSVAADIGEQEKAALQRQRDEALAKLAQETHAVNLKTTTESENANIGTRAKLTSDALDANAPAQNARDAAKMNTEADTKLAIAKRQQPEQLALADEAALAKAKNQGAVDRITEENRTPEQQKFIDAKLAEAQALVGKTKAETGEIGARGRYYDAQAGKADKSTPKVDNKVPEWIPDKNRPGYETITADNGDTIVRQEIAPVRGQPAVVDSFLHLRDKAEVPGKPMMYKYSLSDGTPLTSTEAANMRRGASLKPAEDRSTPDAAQPSMPDITAIESDAKAFIAAHPEKEAQVRAKYRRDTGKDLK